MKATLLLTATTFLCLGSVIHCAAPSWADSLPVNEDAEMTGVEDSAQPSSQTADLLLVEPRRFNVSTDEKTDALNAVASQINQVIESDSDDFLPEGVVVRGSQGSLQLGSEL